MENNRYKTVLGSEKEAHIHTQLNQTHAIINNNKSRIVFHLREHLKETMRNATE